MHAVRRPSLLWPPAACAVWQAPPAFGLAASPASPRGAQAPTVALNHQLHRTYEEAAAGHAKRVRMALAFKNRRQGPPARGSTSGSSSSGSSGSDTDTDRAAAGPEAAPQGGRGQAERQASPPRQGGTVAQQAAGVLGQASEAGGAVQRPPAQALQLDSSAFEFGWDICVVRGWRWVREAFGIAGRWGSSAVELCSLAQGRAFGRGARLVRGAFAAQPDIWHRLASAAGRRHFHSYMAHTFAMPHMQRWHAALPILQPALAVISAAAAAAAGGSGGGGQGPRGRQEPGGGGLLERRGVAGGPQGGLPGR